MHPLCAHYRFMTLVKRKGGGCLLTCLTFKFRRHCCQVLCSTFCPMRDREGLSARVPSSTSYLVWVSKRVTLGGWEHTRIPHLQCNECWSRSLWCIVHQSESSVGSAACVYVIQNNNSWGSRHCSIRHNEHWDPLQRYEMDFAVSVETFKKKVLTGAFKSPHHQQSHT